MEKGSHSWMESFLNCREENILSLTLCEVDVHLNCLYYVQMRVLYVFRFISAILSKKPVMFLRPLMSLHAGSC